jgi:hypothetical protein
MTFLVNSVTLVRWYHRCHSTLFRYLPFMFKLFLSRGFKFDIQREFWDALYGSLLIILVIGREKDDQIGWKYGCLTTLLALDQSDVL